MLLNLLQKWFYLVVLGYAVSNALNCCWYHFCFHWEWLCKYVYLSSTQLAVSRVKLAKKHQKKVWIMFRVDSEHVNVTLIQQPITFSIEWWVKNRSWRNLAQNIYQRQKIVYSSFTRLLKIFDKIHKKTSVMVSAVCNCPKKELYATCTEHLRLIGSVRYTL